MQKRDIEAIGLTAVAGVILSLLGVLYFNRLPAVPLAGKYLLSQAGLFYSLIGMSAPYVYNSHTVRMRLLSLYITASGVSTIIILVILNGTVPLLIGGLILMISSAVAIEVIRRKSTVEPMLLRGIAFVLSALVAFFGMFLIVSLRMSGDFRFSVPLLLAGGGYYLATKIIRQEHNAI